MATLRDALVGLLMSLLWPERSADLLIKLLQDSDTFVVAGAIHALSRHPEAVARIDRG
jgi:hypothetical protein